MSQSIFTFHQKTKAVSIFQNADRRKAIRVRVSLSYLSVGREFLVT